MMLKMMNSYVTEKLFCVWKRNEIWGHGTPFDQSNGSKLVSKLVSLYSTFKRSTSVADYR